jgi:hypothetical protein
MRKPQKKFKLLVATAVVVLFALFTYGFVLPEYIAGRYIDRIHQKADTLRNGYNKLEESTGRAFVDDPTARTFSQTEEVESLHSLLRENRINLDQFSSVAKNYRPLPYTGFTPQARAAHAMQVRSIAFTEQSYDAFLKYDELIDFIKRYDTTARTVERHIAAFNATPDLNVYEGQANRVFAIAEEIRFDIKTLESSKTPHEAVEFKAVSVREFTRIADGFAELALGLQIPADAVIYSGAQKIEAADRVINSQNRAIYARDVLTSRTIKSVQELREKLDLILP